MSPGAIRVRQFAAALDASGHSMADRARMLRSIGGPVTVTLLMRAGWGAPLTGRLWGVHPSDDEVPEDVIVIEVLRQGTVCMAPEAVEHITIADVQLTDEDFI